jgi:hypothetical protein
VARALQVLFMVSANRLWHDVVNVSAWCASTAALSCHRVHRVTYFTDHAERVTPDDHNSELLPLPAVATFTAVATVAVKLSPHLQCHTRMTRVGAFQDAQNDGARYALARFDLSFSFLKILGTEDSRPYETQESQEKAVVFPCA